MMVRNPLAEENPGRDLALVQPPRAVQRDQTGANMSRDFVNRVRTREHDHRPVARDLDGPRLAMKIERLLEQPVVRAMAILYPIQDVARIGWVDQSVWILRAGRPSGKMIGRRPLGVFARGVHFDFVHLHLKPTLPKMQMPGSNAEVSTTALVVGGAIVVSLALALGARSHTKTERFGPTGKPLRPIHVLESNSLILGDLVERVANGERLFNWYLEKWVEYNGEPWVFKIPGQEDLIMFSTPEAYEDITVRQFALFDKGSFQSERILDMFGYGLVGADGAHWLHQRKAAAKFFSANALRTMMTENMQTNIGEVCAVIEKSILSPSKVVDLRQLFHEFTLETFVEIGMGVDLNCIGAATRHPFQTALDVIAPITSRRFRLPGVVWKTERWLNIGPEAILAKHKKILREWLHKVLEQSLANARDKTNKADTADRKRLKSVVELFVDHSDDGAEGLQPDDLMGFILTFVIAARDTTANTLCWMLYAMSKDPRIEQKIRAEMVVAFGDEEISFLTTDHIKKLTYLEATIKEAVRLFPGGPFTVRQANQTTLICGETLVRKGQVVGMCAWAMARLPNVWGPDAAEFKPERWIDPATGQILNVPLTKYFSFSAGPRTCIGMNLAMLELRVVMANVLYRYTFEIDPSNDGSYEVAPTLNMNYPLLAKATRVRGG